MKPCKFCNGIGTNGIGQDYCKCVECDGTGEDTRDSWLVVTVSGAALISIVVTILVEVMR
jgi:DnaJ-class molecular chaperone